MNGPSKVPLSFPAQTSLKASEAGLTETMKRKPFGRLAHPTGRIAPTWRVEDDPGGPSLAWTWNELDGPPPSLPTREGFGTRLLNRILTAQTAAEVNVAFDADGLRVHVRVPLEHR
jgi:two-component sensor histidine kinase